MVLRTNGCCSWRAAGSGSLRLRTGGWMALGFATENGPDRALAERFRLEAFTRGGELQPIRRNVKESDGTLWIAAPPRIESDPAYWVTRKAVATYGDPFLSIASKVKAQDAGQEIAMWAQRWNVARLHVLGPRASLWAGGETRARGRRRRAACAGHVPANVGRIAAGGVKVPLGIRPTPQRTIMSVMSACNII